MAGYEIVAQLVAHREADKALVFHVGGVENAELISHTHQEPRDTRLVGFARLNHDPAPGGNAKWTNGKRIDPKLNDEILRDFLGFKLFKASLHESPPLSLSRLI